MGKIILALALLAVIGIGIAGCGKIDGPRFWWDDKTQSRLPEDYQLPDEPGAPSEIDAEPTYNDITGQDLSDDKLHDYNTNLDLEEERRKSEASLFDF